MFKKQMASTTLFYTSLNSSTTVFSRTHYPVPLSKDLSVEFLPSLHYNLGYFGSKTSGFKKRATHVKATLAEAPPESQLKQETAIINGFSSSPAPQKKLRILVAGGGIGGLVLALAAKRKGFEVMVFEKDLSAIRGEGQYRGPIQIQSNALAALEAIDLEVAEEVMKVGCITGDRINGLVDGVSGTW